MDPRIQGQLSPGDVPTPVPAPATLGGVEREIGVAVVERIAEGDIPSGARDDGGAERIEEAVLHPELDGEVLGPEAVRRVRGGGETAGGQVGGGTAMHCSGGGN